MEIRFGDEGRKQLIGHIIRIILQYLWIMPIVGNMPVQSICRFLIEGAFSIILKTTLICKSN